MAVKNVFTIHQRKKKRKISTEDEMRIDKEKNNLQKFKTTQLRKIGKLLRIPNYSRIPRGKLIDAVLHLTGIKTSI